MSYIYSTAKHRRSATTMQKHMPRSAVNRYEAAREIMQGYPWLGKFGTREQVDEYLGGAEITCLLCGKKYKCLAPHVKRVHGVSAENYKELFGLPQGRGIDCAITSKARSDINQGNTSIKIAQAVKMNAIRSKPSRRTKLPDFVKKENAERFRECARNQPRASDFSWHFEKLSTVWRYMKETPPDGFVSWSRFKKYWLNDADLREQMKIARSAIKQRALT